MLSQSYTDRYFIHKKILSSAIFKAGLFLFFLSLIGGCATNQDQLITKKINKDILDRSFVLSGSISIKSMDGNFIGSYTLNNGLDESFHVKDIFGREVFSIDPTISVKMIDKLDEQSFEIYQYFQDWKNLSSVLLAIDDGEDFKSKHNISINYSGYRVMHSLLIPKTISVMGSDYELTFTIKSLKLS
ncbi:MAG TPA: hypothetical protein QF540_03520 [Gammaproteobacteria bacterium]|nr:hypothetical protein [Gammaproteobacteria bacterium]HJN00605.1 hypothetical protein [Gammaproteobacteria bacterium]